MDIRSRLRWTRKAVSCISRAPYEGEGCRYQDLEQYIHVFPEISFQAHLACATYEHSPRNVAGHLGMHAPYGMKRHPTDMLFAHATVRREQYWDSLFEVLGTHRPRGCLRLRYVSSLAVQCSYSTVPSVTLVSAECPHCHYLGTYPLSLSTIHYPLSTIHYPLSTVHCPLSTVHCPLSTVHCPLSTVHCPPI
jgi:hypothetical protein